MYFQRLGLKPNFKKNKIALSLFILFTISLQSIVFASKKLNYEKNWIQNSDFSLSEDYWFTSVEGDKSDGNATIYSEEGNFEIYGEERTFSLVANPPLALDWYEMDNPDFPDRPDFYEITSEGCRVSHIFNDTSAVQHPSVHWDQNITMPVNMTDYLIKSASIQAIVNATVDENLDRLEDYLTGDFARLDPNEVVDTYSVGDYVRFYIKISDLEKNKVYEIAYFQTEQIGSSNPPGKDYLLDTYMLSVPQEVLVFYLESVLDTDKSNFTITLGIRLHIEDNLASYWDLDNFDELYIKFVNFTFTYRKKIDQYTSISLNQIGDSINETNVRITNAVLDFKYKISETWPDTAFQNSELKILINNFELEKNIKFNEMNTSFQVSNLGINDLKAYILTNINISISIGIYIIHDFDLDRKITISIDDIHLIISYSVFMRDPFQKYLIWIILIILLVIVSILSSLSLRAYIFVPRKLRKKNALLLRTQKFKDAENIQGILLIQNTSGLPIFSKNYSELMEGKNELFSAFIQAISLVGEEISLKKKIRSKGFRKEVIEGIYDIFELDFKHFYCLIFDIEELRTVLILNNKASKRLKQQLLNFGLSVYAKFSETLKNWDNDLDPFKLVIPNLLNNYFYLYYKDFFKLTIKKSDIDKIKKEIKLSRTDLKVLNEIFKISEKENIFRLIELLEKLNDKNEDSIIDSIEILIRNHLLDPVNPIES